MNTPVMHSPLFVKTRITLFDTIQVVCRGTNNSAKQVILLPMTARTLCLLLLILIAHQLTIAQTSALRLRSANHKNSCWYGVKLPGPYQPTNCYNAYMLDLISTQNCTIVVEKLWLSNKVLLPIQDIRYERGRKGGKVFRKNELLIAMFNDKKPLPYKLPPYKFKGAALMSYLVNGKRNYLEMDNIKSHHPE